VRSVGKVLTIFLGLAALAEGRSVLRAGLFDAYFESGSQPRVDPNWQRLDDSRMSECDAVKDCWEEHETWTSGRTWVLGAGWFLNDNFRLGMRWETATAHGAAPAPFDSSVVSLEAAWFSHPQGPLSASIALRAGMAPGFPDRDPPNFYPPFGIPFPARVYGAGLGVRWIATPHVAIDADLVSTELWASNSINVWHFSWLTPRVSVLF
jgi:hypothetical protein